MTCSSATGVWNLVRPCSMLTVLVIATSLLVTSHGTSAAKAWLADSLRVEAAIRLRSRSTPFGGR